MDLSHLDKKYFIDVHIYNCPFCRRNNVSYVIESHFVFDWDSSKKCYGYLVKCLSIGCEKISLHLSSKDLGEWIVPYSGQPFYRFKGNSEIDAELFYSQPTSYFVLDNRIPEVVRALIYEAESSRKFNLLVGASACLRKAVYELLEYEKAIVTNANSGRADYQKSIKSLKVKFPNVAPGLFDALLQIQGLASDNVHEGSWESWNSSKLSTLIELTKAVVHEMYVVPEELKVRLGVLNQINSDFSNSKDSMEESSE